MRIRWIPAAVAALALDVYLVWWQWPAIGGNVLAEPVIATPAVLAYVAHHLEYRRHVDRQHAALHRRLDETQERLDEALGDRDVS